jgi:hypothetical protein
MIVWHRLAKLLRPDPVRPHHLVVFVLDDVTVPDELAGIGDDRVLLGWFLLRFNGR